MMRGLWLSICCLFVVLGFCSPALAHASLIASSPAQLAVLAAAPSKMTLTFNEPVSPTVLALIAPDGSKTPLADFRLVGNELDITPPADLPNGTSVLSYRIISSDGHPVGGSIIFSIGAPSAGAAMAEPEAVDWPLRGGIWAGRVLLYAGLFFGVGGVFFRGFVAPGTFAGRRAARGVLLAGMAGAVVSVGLQGLDVLGFSLAAIVQPEVWAAGLASSFGTTAVIAFVAMGLALLADRLGRRWLAVVAFAGIGLALASTGHAAAADPQWLTRPAVFLHATGIAFWAGALVPLWGLLRTQSSEAVAALRRFSRAIPYALLPLIVAGIVLAVIQVGTPSALVDTAYGRVLLAKLVLLVGVFGLAAFNRWRLTGPVKRGSGPETRALVRVIVVETVLIFAVMGVAATWRFTPPPRALALAVDVPLYFHIHTDRAMADVSLKSSRTGENAAEIVLMTGDFGSLDAQALGLVASNPAAGIEPVRYQATKSPDGTWQVEHLSLPRPGAWKIELEIRVSDFEMVRISDLVTID
jgi:copper transport protein